VANAGPHPGPAFGSVARERTSRLLGLA
jgi:hypothetical protein